MKRIILPAAILLASLTTAALAQNAASPRDGSRLIRRIEHRLDITGTQREQARAILAAEKPTLQQLHATLAAERAEMIAASATTFDEARTRAIAPKYVDANMQAVVEREKLRTELLAILTSAQQQKVQELRTRFAAGLNAHLETLGDNL